MEPLFEHNMIPKDEDGHRTCGTCLERKSVEHFYKDGKDADGNNKYRRDCKQCYRITRLRSRQAKRAPLPKKRGRK
jgi:hypothetical protein